MAAFTGIPDEEHTKRVMKLAYQRGYRAGRAWEGKAWKKALKDWYSREQTGIETNL